MPLTLLILCSIGNQALGIRLICLLWGPHIIQITRWLHGNIIWDRRIYLSILPAKIYSKIYSKFNLVSFLSLSFIYLDIGCLEMKLFSSFLPCLPPSKQKKKKRKKSYGTFVNKAPIRRVNSPNRNMTPVTTLLVFMPFAVLTSGAWGSPIR